MDKRPSASLQRSSYEATYPILLSVCVYVLFIGAPSNGQETNSAGIVGRVTDATQAGIPGASVVVTNTGTNAQRSTQTNEVGEFSVPNLAPARYQIQGRKAGLSIGYRRAIRAAYWRDCAPQRHAD